MPKGTIITISAEEKNTGSLPLERSTGKRFWECVTSRASYIVLGSFCRDNWLIWAIAFLLSRVSLSGELAPCGFAFYAAVADSDRRKAMAAGLFCIIGLIVNGRFIEAGFYLCGALLYFGLVKKQSFAERKFKATPLYVFAIVFFAALPVMIWRQPTLYGLMLIMFEALTCMILTYIFIIGVKFILKPYDRQVPYETLLCFSIILAIAVAGLGDIQVSGYSIRNITASFIVMVLALAGGSSATAVGVTVGLAIGLTDAKAADLIILYSVGGLFAGIFVSLGRIASALGFLLGSMIAVLHLGNSAEFMTIITESAVAVSLSLLLPARWQQNFNGIIVRQPENSGKHNIMAATAKLNSLAEIFTSLASTVKLNSNADNQKRELEITGLLASVGEQVCGRCKRRARCWDSEYYQTYQAMIDALERADKLGLAAATLPDTLKDNCFYCRELADIINNVAHYNRNCSFRQNKILANRQLFDEQLKAIGEIIANLAGDLDNEQPEQSDLAAALKNKAAYINCRLDNVKIVANDGLNAVEIIKRKCEGNRECVNTILPLTSGILKRKMKLHSQCGENRANGKCRLLLEVAECYSVRTGMARSAKEQGISGDTCSVIQYSPGKIALILSDGMGSGRRAAGESAAAVEFLVKMLKAGFDVYVAVKTVNEMLILHGGNESFATLDIAVIDTIKGELEFIKVGAAPSYIKRVREVAAIKSSSPPIGILEQVELDPVKWSLSFGDVIVMVSDGIIEIPSANAAREPWLVNYLRRAPEEGAQEMADRILRQAIELAGQTLRDDMTVMVAKIKAKQGLDA